jgi:hypothetical protein
MITKQSTGSDWLKASPAVRSEYVERKCRACEAAGIGSSSPALVSEGISAFFAIPKLRHHLVSFAFGNIHTALVKLGDYHALVDSFSEGTE